MKNREKEIKQLKLEKERLYNKKGGNKNGK